MRSAIDRALNDIRMKGRDHVQQLGRIYDLNGLAKVDAERRTVTDVIENRVALIDPYTTKAEVMKMLRPFLRGRHKPPTVDQNMPNPNQQALL